MNWFPKYTMNSLKLNKTNHSIKKWIKNLNRYFTKDIQMANKHIKRCLTSFAIT